MLKTLRAIPIWRYRNPIDYRTIQLFTGKNFDARGICYLIKIKAKNKNIGESFIWEKISSDFNKVLSNVIHLKYNTLRTRSNNLLKWLLDGKYTAVSCQIYIFLFFRDILEFIFFLFLILRSMFPSTIKSLWPWMKCQLKKVMILKLICSRTVAVPILCWSYLLIILSELKYQSLWSIGLHRGLYWILCSHIC